MQLQLTSPKIVFLLKQTRPIWHLCRIAGVQTNQPILLTHWKNWPQFGANGQWRWLILPAKIHFACLIAWKYHENYDAWMWNISWSSGARPSWLGKMQPEDERNRRQRCAVLVEVNDKVILVDAGPDIRNQLIPLGLKKIDALLITHTHSDHVAGLDDLRAFYWPNRNYIPVYATKQHSRNSRSDFRIFFKTGRIAFLFYSTNENANYFCWR